MPHITKLFTDQYHNLLAKDVLRHNVCTSLHIFNQHKLWGYILTYSDFRQSM